VRNGGFETGDFSGWITGATTPAFKLQVVRQDGNHVALLGDPTANCNGGAPHNGAAWLYQTITVPATANPVLSFRYRVVSQDDERFEALNVYVRDVNGDVLEQVLHAGAPRPATLCERAPWDSGWREKRFSLALHAGQQVQVYFELRSEDDRGYFNTWAYLDQVEVK